MLHKAGRWYINQVCASEYEHQPFLVHNERTIEYRFALQALGEYLPKRVLDVGPGKTAFPSVLRDCGYVVTAIDNVRDYWPDGMVNRHWWVRDVDILNPGEALSRKYEAITCISVLEHIADHKTAMKNMAQFLEPGGILILTTPFSSNHPHPNVYAHPDALYGRDLAYGCRSSSASELAEWLTLDLTLVRRELWKLFTGEVWATGERCPWQKVEREDQPHQLGCFLFQRKKP